MQGILDYLNKTYQPLAILLYGSYQNGTNDEYSDFDCMLIVAEKGKNHDDSVIDGVQLDCFLFTEEETVSGDPDTFLTAYDARIVKDNGSGVALQQRVREYVAENSDIGEEEKQFIASWIRKTMKRAQKNDDEGSFRAIAFLWESLTDYMLLRGRFYFGSKKTIAFLRENDEAGYRLFRRAISERSNEAIAEWAEYVVGI